MGRIKNPGLWRKIGRYFSRCLLCGWTSHRFVGPVFAAWTAVKHTKQHPGAEGVVAVVIEEEAEK